jgi:hypothetical protein
VETRKVGKNKGLSTMGVNGSRQYSDTINRTVSKNTASLFTKITNTNKSDSQINQTVNLVNNGTLNCTGGFKINQTGKAVVFGLSEITAEQTADLSAKVAAEYQVAAKQAAEQANQDLNFGSFNFGSNATKIVNESIAISEIAVRTSLSNDIKQSATTNQVINFEIGRLGIVTVEGACIFDQNASIEMIAQNAAQSITDVLLATDAGQKLQLSIDQAVAQKNKGINLTVLYITIGVIVGIGIIAGIILAVLKAKGKLGGLKQ